MKKNILIVIIITIILVIVAVSIIWILRENRKDNNILDKESLVDVATTTLNDRNLWNDFLIRNPYLSKININENEDIKEDTFINLAISSQDIDKEFISDKEVESNPLFATGGGYKKSIESINEYLKNTFGKEDINYNFIETYVEDGKYLIINNDYVYFTELELPKNYYILVNLQNADGIYKAEIYEYSYNEETKNRVEEMLQTGKINKELKLMNRYIIKAKVEDNSICIISKT